LDGSALIAYYDRKSKIEIPAGLTAVGDHAFRGCENLDNITVEKQNPRFAGIDGILFDKV
jgi:hypothetical protein